MPAACVEHEDGVPLHVGWAGSGATCGASTVQRKELICILILAGLVALTATVRFLRVPPGTGGPAGGRLARQKPDQASGIVGETRKSLLFDEDGRPFELSTARDVLEALDHGGQPGRQPAVPSDPKARKLLAAAEGIYDVARAAPARNEDLFEAAISVYRHFVERYPGEAGGDLARIRTATAYTLLGRHADAAKAYSAVLEGFPQSPYRPLALLFGGDAHWLAGSIAHAERMFALCGKECQDPFAKAARGALRRMKERTAAR